MRHALATIMLLMMTGCATTAAINPISALVQKEVQKALGNLGGAGGTPDPH